MDSVEFLDAVRARHGIPSDNKLATFLGIVRPRISMYRTRKRKLAPADCFKVARALEEPIDYVMAEIQAEKAQRVEDRAVWKRLSHLAKKGSAVVITAVSIIGLLTLGDADPASLLAFSAVVFPTQYTLCAYVVLTSACLLSAALLHSFGTSAPPIERVRGLPHVTH